MTENIPKLMSDIKLQILEAQKTPSRVNAKTTTSRHIIFKLQKVKDKKSRKKPEEKKHPTYRETNMKITYDFSEGIQLIKDRSEIFKFSRKKKKNSTNLKFYILQNNLSKVKEK